MRCHYDVLEISKEAEESEIKSAYRKLALKWHPDKNLDNQDYAKEQFQLVQQAYEILSDKQERAWYDAHRDQILYGANSEFQDKSLDVFQYFTTTCFKGYGDDEKGFFTVYRNVFDQIAKEDIEFMDEKEEFCEIPCFGKSDSDYDDVVKVFYDYWMSYSTKKSYSWLDPYDIREGKGDRRLLKIIEKENKKFRQKARKERNEEVRNLVAFVRKRDKRVQAYKKEMEAKTLENRKKQELLSKQRRLARKNQHANEKQADWLKFDNVKSELEEIEKHLAQEFGEDIINSEEEEELDDFNNLYCIACNKVFKNPKAFENHESSRKHKENVEQLKQTMLDEDLESNFTDNLEEYNDIEGEEDDLGDIEENGVISGEESLGDEEAVSEIGESSKKKKKQRRKNENYFQEKEDSNVTSDLVEENSGEEEDIDDAGVEEIESDRDPEEIKKDKNKRKNKRGKAAFNTSNVTEGTEETSIVDMSLSDSDFDFGISKSRKKRSAKKANASKTKQNDKKPDDIQDENVDIDNNEQVLLTDQQKSSTPLKKSKKDKKSNKKDVDLSDLGDIDTNHCCVTCKGSFPSKNKLFDHLKKTGHGVYIPPKVKKEVNKKRGVKD